MPRMPRARSAGRGSPMARGVGQRLLADGPRLRVPPGEHQGVAERGQHRRPLGRRRLRGHEARPPGGRRPARRRGRRRAAGSCPAARAAAPRRTGSAVASTRSMARRTNSAARGPRPVRSASSAAQARTAGRSMPGHRLGRGHVGPQPSSARSRCRDASARPQTASASRAARTDAASASPGRPAALQCRASSPATAGRRRARVLGQGQGDPLVQRLRPRPAGSWRTRPRRAGRAGTGRPPRRVRHQDPVLDRLRAARRPAPVRRAGRGPRAGGTARRGRTPPPPAGPPGSRRSMPADALQERVAQQPGQRPLAAVGRGEQLLGEERVPARAGGDRRRSAPRAAPGRRRPPAGRQFAGGRAAPGRARRRRRPGPARPESGQRIARRATSSAR